MARLTHLFAPRGTLFSHATTAMTALALTFAGCASSSDDGDTENGEEAAPEGAETDAGAPEGTEGSPAPEGIEGTPAPEGIEGTPAPEGIEGTPAEGPEGDAGTEGIEGAEGIEGQEGIEGAEGTEGEEGTEGIEGDAGVEGIEGDAGAEGLEGDAGTEGTEGDAGVACTDDCTAADNVCVDQTTAKVCAEANDGDPCLELIEAGCLTGEACDPTAGQCAPLGATGRAPGSECFADAQCQDGPCVTSFPGGYCSPDCTATSTCATGALCLKDGAASASCYAGCAADAGCRSGYICEVTTLGGACMPACAGDADCAPGTCNQGSGRCLPPAPTAAYCQACAASHECLDDGVCLSAPGQLGAGFCAPGCTADADCAKDAACIEVSDGKGGLVGKFCQPKSGDCAKPYLAVTGEACTGNSQCASSLCVPSEGCTVKCGAITGCPFNWHCGAGFNDKNGDGTPDEFYGLCAKLAAGKAAFGATCTAQADCGTGLCVTSDDGKIKLCSDLCTTDADCPSAMTCKPKNFNLPVVGATPYNVCVPVNEGCRPTNGGVETCDCLDNDCDGATDEDNVCPNSGISVLKSEFDLDLEGGLVPSKALPVCFPANGVSLAFIVDETDDSFTTVAELRDSAGQNIAWDDTTKKDTLPEYFRSSVHSVLVPMGPQTPALKPGLYQVRFAKSGAAAKTRVTALVKTAASGLASQKFDINVYLADLSALGIANAAAAEANADFRKFTDALAPYTAAGITIGKVTFKDLDAANAQKFATVDMKSGVLDLFALSSASTGNVINLFVVDDIVDDEGFTILGVAGGLPGPFYVHGTKRSGVVLALGAYGAEWPKFADEIALTVAHEFGHYFGLLHTSERDGKGFDLWPDTPECAAANDANGDGIMSSAECESLGADNLMWWIANDGKTIKLSPQQIQTIEKNPILH